jgi:hypothetical protein
VGIADFSFARRHGLPLALTREATMASQATERAPRGLSFPFLLSVVLFAAVLGDLLLAGRGFIASSAYRGSTLFLAGTAIAGFLLWLWVLAAARRRSTRFDGPILEVRGSNGALQPILATILIVIGLNLAWTHALPRWLNGFSGDWVSREDMIIANVGEERHGCSRADASSATYGVVVACLPAEIADAARGRDRVAIAVNGTGSWFGIDPWTYEILEEQPIVSPALTVTSSRRDPAAPTLKSLGSKR